LAAENLSKRRHVSNIKALILKQAGLESDGIKKIRVGLEYVNTILLRWHLWYFSNDNDYENGNTLKVVNGYENENYIDFQNENNIKIKTMSYKTYKNENVLKENEK